MRLHTDEMLVRTEGAGLYEVTAEVAGIVTAARMAQAQCTVFVRHTSASLVIQENADPAVLRDLQRFMERIAPEGAGYEHDDEGPDDMPAHIRSALTQTQLMIPVLRGHMALGTWQGIYLWEHRRAPHARKLVVQLMGA
ncbi:MAG: secondary thiamine-phosphate synthase enzyme YjbQ [Myxococcales bacterium]|nr:secondary thiamine-phosphate synthase enzyme YjbQ [Myxococcales bacterium]